MFSQSLAKLKLVQFSPYLQLIHWTVRQSVAPAVWLLLQSCAKGFNHLNMAQTHTVRTCQPTSPFCQYYLFIDLALYPGFR